METVNGAAVQNEKILFHGTDLKTANIICHRGFNRSYCEMHGSDVFPVVSLSRQQFTNVELKFHYDDFATKSATKFFVDFVCVLSRTKFHYSDTNEFFADLSRTLSQPS